MLAFEKPPNGPIRYRITVDILKIDGEDFKRTKTPLEAKNLIYVGALSLERGLFYRLDISFKSHPPVITYRLREQINVDNTFESEDFVFERETGAGRSILEGRIWALRIPKKQSARKNQFPMTR